MGRAHRVSRPRAAHRGLGLSTAATIVIGLTISLAALFTVGGFSTVAFTSGSMEPTISEGSLALTREVPAADTKVGDVVSVVSPDGERVTHRVVATENLSWITALTLRGDANRTDDHQLYLADRVDEVVLSVPYLGRYAAADRLILLMFGASGAWIGIRAVRRGRARHRGYVAPVGVRSLATGGTALGVVVAAVLTAAPTSAYWTDTALAAGGEFRTRNVSSPGGGSCSVDGSDIDGTWTNAGQRFDYVAALYTTGGSPQQVGAYTSAYQGALNATTNVTRLIAATDFATVAQIQATGEYNFTVRVYAHPYGSTNTTERWLSASYISIPIHFEAFSGSNYQMRCGYDVDTTVDITAIGTDSGSSSTDLITNVAANTVVGTGEPGATIVLRRGGVQIGSATVTAGGTWSASVTLTEGNQTIEATATDAVGNAATDTQAVVLDTVAPSVTQQAVACSAVGNPVAGVPSQNWCKVTSRGWTATFADNTGGSGLVPATGSQFNNNGAGWTNYTAQVSMAQANGRVMQARATDVAGNVATASGTYYIDGTAPTVTPTAPTEGLSLSLVLLGPLLDSSCGGNIACGSAEDGVSGFAGVSPVTWKMIRGTTTCYTATGTTACANYSFQATSGNAADWTVPRSRVGFYSILSSYTFVGQATDAAGNVGTATVEFSTLL